MFTVLFADIKVAGKRGVKQLSVLKQLSLCFRICSRDPMFYEEVVSSSDNRISSYHTLYRLVTAHRKK
jgi:hypothetical protein